MLEEANSSEIWRTTVVRNISFDDRVDRQIKLWK